MSARACVRVGGCELGLGGGGRRQGQRRQWAWHLLRLALGQQLLKRTRENLELEHDQTGQNGSKSSGSGLERDQREQPFVCSWLLLLQRRRLTSTLPSFGLRGAV